MSRAGKLNASRKRILTAAIAGGLFVILTILYFAVIKPLLITPATEDPPPELLPGEVLGANNRILLFEQVERADVLRLEVHNQNGSYTFYRGKDNEFYIEGMEGAPYNLELFSSLVVSSGYTLSMARLEDATRTEDGAIDLSVYGLSEDDPYAWYQLTKMNGTKHTVKIGSAIPTGAGYYCQYEGREAVYILDSTLASTLLANVRSFITPTLGYPVSTANYTKVDDFWIMKDGELFLWIDALSEGEFDDPDKLMDYVFKHPEGYSPNLSAYSAILEKLSNFAGSETVACGDELDDLDKEMMKSRYGIDFDAPYFLLHYACDGIESVVIFSEPDEDGGMYAYGSIFNLVAKISEADASFTRWPLLQFVDPPLFSKNINKVSRIEIKGSIDDDDEKLDVDAYFTLEGEGETIVIKQNGEARAYDADSVKNFRQLYKVILGLRLQDESDRTDKEAMTEMARLHIVMDDGSELDYRFYIYSTRRCFYTVNGNGEFYLLRDSVEKMLRDTDRMVRGVPIDSDAKN